jgi:hypothetical protein
MTVIYFAESALYASDLGMLCKDGQSMGGPWAAHKAHGRAWAGGCPPMGSWVWAVGGVYPPMGGLWRGLLGKHLAPITQYPLVSKWGELNSSKLQIEDLVPSAWPSPLSPRC